MHRRGFLALTGSALTAVALQAIVADTPRLAAVARGRHGLDEQVVTDLERLAELRRGMDDQLGGGALHDALTSDLRLVTQLLSNTSYPEGLGNRLYAVAAELARLAGWCCHDAGAQGAAQRHWLVALRAAEQAQDRALGAHVLTVMGVQAAAVGNLRESITLYNSAKHIAGTSLGATQRAVIAGVSAGAYARSGDARETAAQADETFTYLEQSRPENDPPWIVYWGTKAQLSGDAGAAFLHLGDPTKAVPHLRTAVDNLPPSCVRDRAHRRIRLATAQLRTGDADHALATAHEATDIASRLSSGKVRDILGDFCREATGTLGNPAAAGLVDHARTTVKL
ncbi:hypothetical protein [Amycolatopsis samaneae]|uniref:Transcriptional regulator n=1 Tax=Amycolatopsis samaneae TaxID=664691 RepID=A0ABW5GBQ5_9PSEU